MQKEYKTIKQIYLLWVPYPFGIRNNFPRHWRKLINICNPDL